MRTALHITQFVLAALVVVILGATLGWYVFVHRQIQTTASQDAARGAGIAPSFGSPQGSPQGFGLGQFQFFNLPNLLSASPGAMLLPKDLVEKDGLKVLR